VAAFCVGEFSMGTTMAAYDFLRVVLGVQCDIFCRGIDGRRRIFTGHSNEKTLFLTVYFLSCFGIVGEIFAVKDEFF
jgi:hypothetical protein